MEFNNKYKVQTLNLWSLLVKHSASEKEIALAQLHIRIPPSLKQKKKQINKPRTQTVTPNMGKLKYLIRGLM